MTTLSTSHPIQENLSNSNFLSFYKQLKRGAIYFGAGIPVSSMASKILKVVSVVDYEQCVRLPNFVYTYARNFCLIREFIPGFNGAFSTLTIKGPFIEEMIFWIGIQETILKKIPKQIFNRFAPSYAGIVDAKITKVARVVFTALAFSLIHSLPPEIGWPQCSIARLVNTFATGLIFGTIQETTESPLMAMLFHSGFNFQSALVMHLLGVKTHCNF